MFVVTANGVLDIILAFDVLPTATSLDTDAMVEFVQNLRTGLELGLSGAVMAYATHLNWRYFYQALTLSDDNFLNLLALHLPFAIGHNTHAHLATLLGLIRDVNRNGVPRTDAPDVIILFSQGYDTVEASYFIQEAESWAR